MSQSEDWEEASRVPRTHVLPRTGGQVMEAPWVSLGDSAHRGSKNLSGVPPIYQHVPCPLVSPGKVTQKSSWGNRTSSLVPRRRWLRRGHTY